MTTITSASASAQQQQLLVMVVVTVAVYGTEQMLRTARRRRTNGVAVHYGEKQISDGIMSDQSGNIGNTAKHVMS